MKKEYYVKKHIGKRVKYEPISEYDPDFTTSMPYGCYVSTYAPGSSSTKRITDPVIAPFVAALLLLREQMQLTNIVVDAHKTRPPAEPLTERQRAVWEEMNKEFNCSYWYMPSMIDIADAILAKMQTVAEELLLNAVNKEAYEQFLLVSSLSKIYNNKLQ